jgi:cytochrome b pre-mRNA-processing protein 3
MLLRRLFTASPGPGPGAGRTLYDAAARQARRPEFYRGLGAPDTVEGRFELYSLHVALLLIRLKGQGPQAAATSQALFDVYVRALDDALRELGVSDVKVGRNMKKLGEAFYGRLKAYEDAISALPDDAGLRDLLARTIPEGLPEPSVTAMAAYVARAAAALSGQGLDQLLEGRVAWPEPAEEQAHG